MIRYLIASDYLLIAEWCETAGLVSVSDSFACRHLYRSRRFLFFLWSKKWVKNRHWVRLRGFKSWLCINNDILKGQWVLYYVFPRQPCTKLSSNWRLMALTATGSALDLRARLPKETTTAWDAWWYARLWAPARRFGLRCVWPAWNWVPVQFRGVWLRSLVLPSFTEYHHEWSQVRRSASVKTKIAYERS